MMDLIIEYTPGGSAIEHLVSRTMDNLDRLNLIAALVGGPCCGARFEVEDPNLSVSVFVRCAAKIATDELNEAASNICGTLVYGTAIVIMNNLIDVWNLTQPEGEKP